MPDMKTTVSRSRIAIFVLIEMFHVREESVDFVFRTTELCEKIIKIICAVPNRGAEDIHVRNIRIGNHPVTRIADIGLPGENISNTDNLDQVVMFRLSFPVVMI